MGQPSHSPHGAEPREFPVHSRATVPPHPIRSRARAPDVHPRAPAPDEGGYRFEPIGFVRSPFRERAEAPRQGALAGDVEARIELVKGRGYDHAVEGLAGWEYVWVLFVFHRNVEQARGWKAKVLPPRSARKQGVFATRSPHRPNPIGLSAVRMVGVDGHVVHVRGLDVLDGTPVLDLKPYVAYADAFPTAGAGWLEARDPLPGWEVRESDEAKTQLDWLAERGIDLRRPIHGALSLGPTPRPYRRIRLRGPDRELAVKDWRVDFTVAEGLPHEKLVAPTPTREGTILVRAIRSGYKARGSASAAVRALHAQFTEMFP
jgi:tRNA-Thr(GGU) m(6)t(6)A37 methyltransferase TsaA